MDPMPEIPDHLKLDEPIGELTDELTDEQEKAINVIKAEMENYLLYDNGKTRIFALPPEMNRFAKLPEETIELPSEFAVFAAFDDQGLAARTSVVMIPHIEGTWVREDLRNGSLGIRLIKMVENGTKETGRGAVYAFAEQTDDKVNDYMQRMGYEKQPLNVWIKYLGNDGVEKELE